METQAHPGVPSRTGRRKPLSGVPGSDWREVAPDPSLRAELTRPLSRTWGGGRVPTLWPRDAGSKTRLQVQVGVGGEQVSLGDLNVMSVIIMVLNGMLPHCTRKLTTSPGSHASLQCRHQPEREGLGICSWKQGKFQGTPLSSSKVGDLPLVPGGL